jgi:hypothetical protein
MAKKVEKTNDGLSRAKAEKLIAQTSDAEKLTQLAGHKNKHVVAKAKHKLGRLSPPNS